MIKSDNDTSDNAKLIEKVNGEINSTDVEKVLNSLLTTLFLGLSAEKINSSPRTCSYRNHVYF